MTVNGTDFGRLHFDRQSKGVLDGELRIRGALFQTFEEYGQFLNFAGIRQIRDEQTIVVGAIAAAIERDRLAASSSANAAARASSEPHTIRT